MAQPPRRKVWLFSNKQILFLLGVAVLFFGIIYQPPLVHAVARVPGRLFWYVVGMNVLYLSIIGAFVFGWLYRQDPDEGGTE